MYQIYAVLRDARGMNDFQVAKATGIDPATFGHWKAGKYTPKIDKIMKIADLFGVPLEVFYKKEA